MGGDGRAWAGVGVRCVLALVVMVVLQATSVSASAGRPGEWQNIEVSGLYRFWVGSNDWKDGEGATSYSFSSQRAVASNGDLTLKVMKEQWEPLRLRFGLVGCGLLDLGERAPAEPLALDRLAVAARALRTETTRLQLGHYYVACTGTRLVLLRVDDLLLDATKTTERAFGNGAPVFDVKCALKARYQTVAWMDGARVLPLAGDATGAPTPREVFESQIGIDMQVAIVDSPWSDGPGWRCGQEPCGHRLWRSHHMASTALVLVPISRHLLGAAVRCWALQKPGRTAEQIAAARSSLEAKYLRPGERGFLLLVRPVIASAFADEWGITMPSLRTAVTLVPFGREDSIGTVTLAEDAGERALTGTDRDFSCLFYLKDVIDEAKDISYSVRVSGIRYRIYLDSTRRGGEKVWHDADATVQARFRIETGSVPLLTYIEQGVPWGTIQSDYVEPHRRVVEATSRRYVGGGGDLSGIDVGSLLYDLGVNLVAGMLMRAILP